MTNEPLDIQDVPGHNIERAEDTGPCKQRTAHRVSLDLLALTA